MPSAKTPEELDLDGTARPDRHGPEPQLQLRSTEPPETLTADQRAVWLQLADELEVDAVDLAVLEVVAVQICRAREAREIIEREGLVILINDGKTETVNPAVKVERDAQTLTLRLLKELRSRYVARKPLAGGSPTVRDPRDLVLEQKDHS